MQTSEPTEQIKKTDFAAVKTFIENTVIGENKVVSMKVLQAVYSDNSNDKHYRHKLKQKILKEYPGALQFVQPSNMCADVVFTKSIFDERMLPAFVPQSNIIHVAKQLREDIVTFLQLCSDTQMATYLRKCHRGIWKPSGVCSGVSETPSYHRKYK